MKELKTAYRCDHCRKIYERKSACEKHESLCKKNPVNIPLCFNCIYSRVQMTNAYVRDTDRDTELKLFYCEAKQKIMYPSTLIRKKKPKVWHNGEQVEMVDMPTDICFDREPANKDPQVLYSHMEERPVIDIEVDFSRD